jgi:hypothetical protein
MQERRINRVELNHVDHVDLVHTSQDRYMHKSDQLDLEWLEVPKRPLSQCRLCGCATARARGAMVAFAPRRVAPIAPGIAPEGVQKAGGAIQNNPMS